MTKKQQKSLYYTLSSKGMGYIYHYPQNNKGLHVLGELCSLNISDFHLILHPRSIQPMLLQIYKEKTNRYSLFMLQNWASSKNQKGLQLFIPGETGPPKMSGLTLQDEKLGMRIMKPAVDAELLSIILLLGISDNCLSLKATAVSITFIDAKFVGLIPS